MPEQPIDRRTLLKLIGSAGATATAVSACGSPFLAATAYDGTVAGGRFEGTIQLATAGPGGNPSWQPSDAVKFLPSEQIPAPGAESNLMASLSKSPSASHVPHASLPSRRTSSLSPIRRAPFAGPLVAVVWLGFATSAYAHHAFAAEFDAKKPVTLKGVVTKMEWTNPHAWLNIDVKTPDGKVERWSVELGAPNALLRRGFSVKSLQAGTAVLVQGFRAKNGLNMANGRDVTLPDGRRLFAGSSGTGAPDDPKK